MNGNDRGNGENRGRNGHVLVWEQTGLEEEDRSVRKRKSMPATCNSFYLGKFRWSRWAVAFVRTSMPARRIPAHPIKPRAEPRVPSVIIRPLARSSSRPRPRPSPLPFHSRSLAPSSANFFLDRCCGHFPSRPSFPFSSTSNLLVREGTRSFSISVLLKKIAPRGSGTEFSVSRIGKLVRREEIAESAEWARIFGHRLRCSRERNWERVPNPKDSRNKKA